MKIVVTLIVVMLSVISSILAQDPMVFVEEKRDNGTYANLFHFTFKPGKSDEGLDVIRNVLIPAFRQSEIKVTLIEDLMGTKDIMLIVPLEQGPAYYEYKMPPQDSRMWAALLALSGSEKQAEENLDKFVALLEKQTQSLIFMPKLP